MRQTREISSSSSKENRLPISRSCLIASEEGWILHREFEICFLSNSLSVTYRSGMHVRETVGESRHVMHCCRGEYSASRSFVSKWIHGVFSNFPRIATLLPLCADTWYRIREAEALENYWISFFLNITKYMGNYVCSTTIFKILFFLLILVL